MKRSVIKRPVSLKSITSLTENNIVTLGINSSLLSPFCPNDIGSPDIILVINEVFIYLGCFWSSAILTVHPLKALTVDLPPALQPDNCSKCSWEHKESFLVFSVLKCTL